MIDPNIIKYGNAVARGDCTAGGDGLCARCGRMRSDHHYNGASYGVCGEFLAAPPSGNAGERAQGPNFETLAACATDLARNYEPSGAISIVDLDGPAGAPPQPAPDALREAAELFKLIEEECWTLKCQSYPGMDDAEVGWEVIEYHMAKPHERVVASGSTPLRAMREAALARPLYAERARNALSPSQSGEPLAGDGISEIVRELREEYPAVDVTKTIFTDLAGVACCVIPQDRVLAIIEVLQEARNAMRSYLATFDRCGGSESISAEEFAKGRQRMRVLVGQTCNPSNSKGGA